MFYGNFCNVYTRKKLRFNFINDNRFIKPYYSSGNSYIKKNPENTFRDFLTCLINFVELVVIPFGRLVLGSQIKFINLITINPAARGINRANTAIAAQALLWHRIKQKFMNL